MLTEEQIQILENEYNIKRETNPDGTCVFGDKDGNGCGKPAVNWLPTIAMDVEGGRTQLLSVCECHAELFGLD